MLSTSRKIRCHYFQSKSMFIQGFIEENVKSTQEMILFAAVKSLKPFLKTYHTLEDVTCINNIIHQAKGIQTYSRCYTLTLSKLSKDIYLHHVSFIFIQFKEIMDVIELNCKISKENNDPEKRKYAVLIIESLVEQVGFASEVLN